MKIIVAYSNIRYKISFIIAWSLRSLNDENLAECYDLASIPFILFDLLIMFIFGRRMGECT